MQWNTYKKPPSALIWPLIPVSWWFAGGYVVVSPFVACLSETFLSLIILFIWILSPPDNLVQSDFSSLRVFSVRKKMHQIMKTHWARFEITSLGGVFMSTNSTVFSECYWAILHYWHLVRLTTYSMDQPYAVTCQMVFGSKTINRK